MQSDGGKPTTVADPESQIAMIYQQMARTVGARTRTPQSHTYTPNYSVFISLEPAS